MITRVPMKRLRFGAQLPTRATELAAGLDLYACLNGPAITLGHGARYAVPCGFAMALPPGMEAQVRPRSGLALQHGVTVLNSPGTVDADYRGEVCALLVNLGRDPFTIHDGDRVAQLVIQALPRVEVEDVLVLGDTPRGADGWGSTGVR